IDGECIYAVDETGFQAGEGRTERVIGAAGTYHQHQQRSGGRENMTVIVTICADGTAGPPAVIFKGKAYHIGYAKKGWTTGEIGRLWIEGFDNDTRDKANGRTRLLLVDGHNSHYTRDFLEYAREAGIVILCYPSHTTHVYQGLDVVIFSPLKRYWSQERDAYEREHGAIISKENFLAVYSAAHARAMTPSNIQMAFQKTGVWPYNPDIISKKAMAPAKETSRRAHIPVPPPTPVR
ncbi:CENP-B protein, partial [Punctularia strigosozonata HHB-11173 SS5]